MTLDQDKRRRFIGKNSKRPQRKADLNKNRSWLSNGELPYLNEADEEADEYPLDASKGILLPDIIAKVDEPGRQQAHVNDKLKMLPSPRIDRIG
jgi:hypothetical protein